MCSKLAVFVVLFSVLAVVSEAGMPLGGEFESAIRGINEFFSTLKLKTDLIMKQHRVRYTNDIIN